MAFLPVDFLDLAAFGPEFLQLCFAEPQDICHSLKSSLELGFLQLTSPDCDNFPAFCFKRAPVVDITDSVPVNLLRPEKTVGFWEMELAAADVAMPKTAVHKDNGPVVRQDDIWFSGQAFVIDAVTVAESPERVTQLQFRLGIRGTDVRHVEVSLL